MLSCGDDATGDAAEAKETNTGKSSTVKIGNLEVMTKNLGEMNWDEAVKACSALGDEWRLPSKDELNLLYLNKDEIGGFADKFYWSSEVVGNVNVWVQGFYIGLQLPNGKDGNASVRAVRAI
jgi:hypothetical protein